MPIRRRRNADQNADLDAGDAGTNDPFEVSDVVADTRKPGEVRVDDFAPQLDVPSFRSSLLVVLLVDLMIVGVLQALLRSSGRAWTSLGIVASASIPFLFMVALRPVVRRIAWRNVMHRPRETALVLLGAMLGTAVITSAFLVGDTLDGSLRATVSTQLGPIDEYIVSDPSNSNRIAAALQPVLTADRVDGVLPMLVARAAIAAAPTTKSEASVPVRGQILEFNFEQAATFGGDPSAVGITAPTPPEGHAVIGADLAAALHLGKGESLDVAPFGAKQKLIIDRIVARNGVAGFWRDGGSRSLNVLVGPGTLQKMAQNAPSMLAPPDYVLAISNPGGVVKGAGGTQTVIDAVEQALGPKVSTGDGGTSGLDDLQFSVVAAKADAISLANSTGGRYRTLFGAISLFSVLAGLVLLLSTFSSLAHERRTEMGMLRAVGLRRSAMLGASTLEGWLYSIVSAAGGAALGLVVARLVVVAAKSVFGKGDRGLELSFAPKATSVATGFAAGFVASLAAVTFAALWSSRKSALRAMRDLPEPVKPLWTRLSVLSGALVSVIGLLTTVAGIARDSPYAVVLGPAMLACGMAAFLWPRVPSTPLVTGLAVATILGELFLTRTLQGTFSGAEVGVFTTLGMMLTGAGVALVSQHQQRLSAIAASMAHLLPGPAASKPGRALAARFAATYPTARRGRTAAVVAMYALVAFTVTFVSLVSALLSGQVARRTSAVRGGFDAVISSPPASLPSAESVQSVAGVSTVSRLTDSAVEIDTAGNNAFQPFTITAFDNTYITGGPSALVSRQTGAGDDRAVYRIAMTEVGAAVIALPDAERLHRSSLTPGRRLSTRDPSSGRSITMKIVGVTPTSSSRGAVLVSPGTYASLFGRNPAPNRILIAGIAGTDLGALVRNLRAATGSADGSTVADVRTIAEMVRADVAGEVQFLRLLQGYLAFGFLIGMVGLAIVMMRAVQERRRQIGILRSLGADGATIRRAFLTEACGLALEGVAVGVVLALATGWRLIGNGAFGENARLVIPAGAITVLTLLTIVASLAAALWPARMAARIRPASALRLEG